jgi:hypothetical protein
MDAKSELSLRDIRTTFHVDVSRIKYTFVSFVVHLYSFSGGRESRRLRRPLPNVLRVFVAPLSSRARTAPAAMPVHSR